MLEVRKNQLAAEQIIDYLVTNDMIFIPALSSRLDIRLYALKLHEFAKHFCVYKEGEIVGFAACYFNHPQKLFAFLSSISVAPESQGKGIASELLAVVINSGKLSGFKELRLNVNVLNIAAARLYKKFGFKEISRRGEIIELSLALRY